MDDIAKDVGMSQVARAQRVLPGLLAYKERFEGEGESLSISISDFLADVMHLCEMTLIDFEQELDRARMNYEAEREEEDDE